MHLGLTGVNAGRRTLPQHAATIARHAEEAGFESLWAVEHVVVPHGYASTYPYSPDGRMPAADDLAIADPLAWLTFAAAATTSIKIATGILILPQRNPVVLAKECATIDVLSSGRLILGVGVGWLREEFDALGIPFEDRGPRTDDYVAALRALWSPGLSTYDGPFASFTAVNSFPKPDAGTIPIVVGGTTEAAARRAGRIGDGFFPWDVPPERLRALLEEMRRAADAAGRDADLIEITVGAFTAEQVRAHEATGVHRVVTVTRARDLDEMRRFVDEMRAAKDEVLPA